MTQVNTKSSTPASWLLSTWTMVICAGVGIVIGLFRPSIVPFIAPISDIYTTVLKMCIAPILLSSIPLNIGLVIQAQINPVYLKRMAVTLLLLLVFVSSIGIITGIIFKPGSQLDIQVMRKLGTIVNQSNYYPDLVIEFSKDYSKKEIQLSNIMLFISHLIPTNIFQALNNNENIKVVFFVTLLGISLGVFHTQNTSELFVLLEIVYLVVNKIIEWLNYLLPLALMGALAEQFALVGVDILFAMTKFAVILVAIYLVIFLFGNFIIACRTSTKTKQTIAAIKSTSVIALATSSSIECIPSAISGLIQNFSVNSQIISFFIPLGFTIFRFGHVLYFAVASLFVIQLYQVDFSIGSLLIVLLGSIFAGLASANGSGDLTLPLLAVILQPLGLPLEAVLVLLIVIDPIIDPFRTLCTVHTNVVGIVLVAKNTKELI